MTIDTSFSLSSLITLALMIGGYLIAIGVMKQKIEVVSDELKRARESLDHVRGQLAVIPVMQAQIASQEAEIIRIRDRMHDTEGAVRGLLAKEKGYL